MDKTQISGLFFSRQTPSSAPEGIIYQDAQKIDRTAQHAIENIIAPTVDFLRGKITEMKMFRTAQL